MIVTCDSYFQVTGGAWSYLEHFLFLRQSQARLCLAELSRVECWLRERCQRSRVYIQAPRKHINLQEFLLCDSINVQHTSVETQYDNWAG